MNAFLPPARAVIALATAYAVVLSLLVAGLGAAEAGFNGEPFCRPAARAAPAEQPAPAKLGVPHDCCFGCQSAAADLPPARHFGNLQAQVRSSEPTVLARRLLAAPAHAAHPPRGPPA